MLMILDDCFCTNENLDPDLANKLGSERIQICNTVFLLFTLFFLLFISVHKNSGLVQNGKKANIEDKNPKKDFTNSDSSDPTKVEQK